MLLPICLRQLVLRSLWLPLAASLLHAAAEPSVTLEPQAGRVRIEIDGSWFSDYIFADAPKPYLYPILAADGTRLNRDFPMADVEGESRDHNHHRSLWFGHGRVNGEDFWLENDRSGTIEQEAVLETTSGPVGVLRTSNRWVANDGTVVCTDERTLRIQPDAGGRLLDFDVTIHAARGPVVFEDTKEGTMSIRVAQWMNAATRVDRQNVPGPGHIINDAGLQGTDAWGKPANWVDYFADHEGKTYGIAIFDHPQNPRHPTWWHVRDYGLFAANPFGQHDFEGLRDQPHAGDFTIPAGDSVTFRYRFYFHNGGTEDAQVASHYRAYAQTAP